MKIKNQRALIVQYTIVSFIFSLLIPLTAIFLDLIKRNIDYTSAGFKTLITSSSVYYLLAILTILIPVATFFIVRNFVLKINKHQDAIIKEQEKSKKVAEYLSRLIKNDFSVNFEVEDKNDVLGNSLVELAKALQDNQEHEKKRRLEDAQRNWIAEGLAKFGAILRQYSDNMEDLAYNVIRELTIYLDAIQGGFYLLNNENEEDRQFDLVAFYAYGRKKFADQHIKWGDGIIGTAAMEKKAIYITEVPEDYIRITSGLGDTNPNVLMVAPMLTSNKELEGVFEIASLKPLEPYQQDFVMQVAESVASTLSSVKINIKTAELLEASKEQAQTMAAQEEEMRQNMEELKATQEEAHRQAEKFVLLENTVNHTMIRAEFDTDGILLYANTKFLKKLEYTSNLEVEGKHIMMFISKKDEEWFSKIWNDLSKGGRHFEGYMKHITKTGKDLWTMATYTCIRDEKGEVQRILFLAIDTTEQQNINLNLNGIVDAVDRSGIKVEFHINGNILSYNETFQYVFKFTSKELKKLTISDLIDPIELENFNIKWENIINGIGFNGQFKIVTADKADRWIRGAFSAVYDMYGEASKVIFIGQDITNEKLMEIESKQQTETLKKQEKLLRDSEKELSRKLKETRVEVENQYKEIAKIKERNEITLEGALDAIITTNTENRIIFFNKAAEEMFGYKRDEVLNKSIDKLFSEKIIAEDKFVKSYVSPGDKKIIGKRHEIKIKDKSNTEKTVIALLSKARIDNENTYTAFIQNIEVEIF